MDEKTKQAVETAREIARRSGLETYQPRPVEKPLKIKKKRWWERLREKLKRPTGYEKSMRTADVERRIGSALTEEELRMLRTKGVQ